MSVTFHIETNSFEEMQALGTEGAPEVNVSNTNGGVIHVALGMPDPSLSGGWDVWGEMDADEFLDRLVAGSPVHRMFELAEVARAAKCLGRRVVWS